MANAKLVVKAGRNEESETRQMVDRAQDGDTIIVPNEKCRAIAKKVGEHKMIFIKIKGED